MDKNKPESKEKKSINWQTLGKYFLGSMVYVFFILNLLAILSGRQVNFGFFIGRAFGVALFPTIIAAIYLKFNKNAPITIIYFFCMFVVSFEYFTEFFQK